MGEAAQSSATSTPLADQGLQAERTALAWTRTAAAVGVNALLSLRSGIAQDRPWVMRLGTVLLLVALALIAYSVLRRRHLRGSHLPVAISVPMVACTALSALVACLVGAAGIWCG